MDYSTPAMNHIRPIRVVNIPRVNMDDPYVYMAVQHLYRSLRHVSRFTRRANKSIQPINRHMTRVNRANHVYPRCVCRAPPQQQKQETRQQRSKRGYNEMPQIHFKNVPYSVTFKEIKDFFSKFGEVAELLLPRNHIHGNPNKGYGFLRFRTIKSTGVCYHAMRNSVQRIGGRCISVDFVKKYKPPQEDRQYVRQLFVGNYPSDKTDSDLKALFSELGEVSNAFLLGDGKGGHRGKGFLSYKNPDVAFYAEKHFCGKIVASDSENQFWWQNGAIVASESERDFRVQNGEIVAGKRIYVRLTYEFKAIDEKSGECRPSEFTKRRTPSISTASTDSLEDNGMPQ